MSPSTLATLAVLFAACGCGPTRSGPAGAPPEHTGRGLGRAGLSTGFVRAPDPYADTDGLCASALETEALATLNAVRDAAGAPPMRCLAPLGRLSSLHAQYLAYNEGIASQELEDRHAERPGSAGFTGETLAARADFVGLAHDAFWLAEGIGGRGEPAEVLATHLATVYHRSHLVSPGGRYFGYAQAAAPEQKTVLGSLASVDIEGLLPAVFPADGAENVPRGFTPAGEVPDPAPDVTTKGYPISVHFPRYLASEDMQEPIVEVEAGAFSLRDLTRDEEVVGLRVLQPAHDQALARSDVFLLPNAPLLPLTLYEARARLRYGAFSIDRRWRFRSGP